MSSLTPDPNSPNGQPSCSSSHHDDSNSGGESSTRRTYWRSLEDVRDTEEFRSWMHREFPTNADILDGEDRRQFMKVMGASFALAGLGLAACRRIPESHIVPYASRPAERIPGKAIMYASACEVGGNGTGVLVRTYDARPIKLEGNPDHSISLGGCEATTQSAVLQVYDPHRSRFVMKDGEGSDAASFANVVNSDFLEKYATTGGKGLAVLAEVSGSPSQSRLRSQFMQAYPEATWVDWDPITGDSAREGVSAAMSSSYSAVPSLEKAKVIVCLDADPLMTHSASTKLAREWANNRRLNNPDPSKQELSRLYSFEGVLSGTGMAADDRVAMRSSKIIAVASAIAQKMGVSNSALSAQQDSLQLEGHDLLVFEKMLEDLVSHKGESLVMAGERQPAEVHALVALINQKLQNNGVTVTYVVDETEDRLKALRALTSSMASGSVSTLVMLGGNPAYTAPVDIDFTSALGQVKNSIHLSLYRNETSVVCNWHLPRSHWLEAWGDVTAFDGTKSITQPTIMPMIPVPQKGWSSIELLAELIGLEPRDGYSIVRATEMDRSATSGNTFERHWRTSLDKGFIEETASTTTKGAVKDSAVLAMIKAPAKAGDMELVLPADMCVFDGRFANLGWLQELPDPVTKLTWDNAALMNPATMQAQGLELGDLVELKVGNYMVKAGVFPVPGMDEETVSLSLGWGRGPEAGPVANGAGFNAYSVRTSSAMDIVDGLRVAKTGEEYSFAHTQDHGVADALIKDVPLGGGYGGVQTRLPTIVREGTLDEYHTHPDFAKHRVHVAHRLSLWEETNLDGAKFKWGMSIDLNTCIGCGACVTACQAENNIPVVGKDQIARGRQMHWLRIDRYFKGEDIAHPEAVFIQPVTCMQCENAPCEQVCPVAATVHDKDGLNVMVYNRCIGTRYCSNNCPYKVRRFNWFDYWRREPIREQEGLFAVQPDYYTKDGPNEWRRMQMNPDVTVRMRGVMEKCNFCQQRINAAKIDYKNKWAQEGGTAFSPDWAIPDGVIMSACQQACSTGSIIFGDLAIESSEVSTEQKKPVSYGLLEELNTKPRVKYLAKVRNPGVVRAGSGHGGHGGHGGDHDGDHDEEHGGHASTSLPLGEGGQA